ncbi:hypothetical protein HZA73_09360 [candidate division TA06 bacterium]|nr:hypothetical protein [candidate division TA06 bacterium]
MIKKIKPLPPIKQSINKTDWNKLKFYRFLCWVLSSILIVSALSIIAHFAFLVFTEGFCSEEAAKYAMYLVAGSYAFLIIDRIKIKQLLGIKDVSYIDEGT